MRASSKQAWKQQAATRTEIRAYCFVLAAMCTVLPSPPQASRLPGTGEQGSSFWEALRATAKQPGGVPPFSSCSVAFAWRYFDYFRQSLLKSDLGDKQQLIDR